MLYNTCMKTFHINVPEKKDFVKWMKILHYKFTGGFTCKECNTKMSFQHIYFNSVVQGKALIFENMTDNLCADCTRDDLTDHKSFVFTQIGCECEWCKEVKPTASWIHSERIQSKIYFGSTWWNGHNICHDCLDDGIRKRGHMTSSVFKQGKDGKSYPVNELGLLVKGNTKE